MRGFKLVVMALLLTTAAMGQVKALSEEEQREGWLLLFNGRDLSGWEVVGNKAAFGVDGEGNLACTAGGGEWIRTSEAYEDFILRLEYKISAGGNSGVFIRATADGNPAFTGMEVQILDDAGKEPDKNSTGSLYDAVRPGKNKSKPAGEWNSYEIKCFGNELRVVLNGEQLYHVNLETIADEHNKRPKLSMRAGTGYIGFQDHGSAVWFRNIKLKKLDRARYPGNDAGWVRAFEGNSTEGWTAYGTAKWTMKDGTLTGEGGPGHLFTNARYRDVEFRAKVRISKGGNSGIFFRAGPPQGDNPWPPGGEAQINNNDDDNRTGGIYGRHRAPELLTRDGEWFDYYIRVIGNRWTTRINGLKVLDLADDTWMEPGQIGIQSHDAGTTVELKDVWIRSHDVAPE